MTIASEVEVKQVRLVIGTGTQIAAARQAGEILNTDLVVRTDAPEIDLSDYAKKTDLDDFVTLNTEQEITAKKKIVVTEGYPASTSDGGQESALKILSSHSDSDMNNHTMWCGRMVIGNKNRTFLLGVYNDYNGNRTNQPICGLGAHTWTDSESESGAAWTDIHIQPDGGASTYIGGYQWRSNSGWLRVKNSGGNTGGSVQVNKGSITDPTWKDVAYKGENISDFNNNSGYITSSALNGYATEQYVDNIVGDIETLLNNINSGS